MNIEKAKQYLVDLRSRHQDTYDNLEEAAQMCGPMSYEDREYSSQARRTRLWAQEEIAKLNDILGENDD